MLLKIYKPGARNDISKLEDVLKASQHIMKKLGDIPNDWDISDAAWITTDADDNDGEVGIEEHFMTCPYCSDSVSGWGKDEAVKNIRKHKKSCKRNPANILPDVPAPIVPDVRSTLTLPIWAL